MQFKMMKTSKLIEHPRNKEFFTDISDSTPALWQAFKENIKDYGIIEPLLVEKGTNNVRSGNQRLKAAIELSMAEVPVVIVDAEIDDEELGILAGEIEDGKIVSSNVFRRNVDNFKMFELIGVLRKGATGKPGPPKGGSEVQSLFPQPSCTMGWNQTSKKTYRSGSTKKQTEAMANSSHNCKRWKPGPSSPTGGMKSLSI